MAEINWNALKTPDYAGDAIAAAQQGRTDALAVGKQNALRRFKTDPEGGIQDLMVYDPSTAVTLQKAEQERRLQASTVKAGQLAKTGDLDGAASVAADAGNFGLMSQIQGMSKEQRAQASAAYGELASTAQSVKSRPYEERKAAIQAQAPRLLALGLKPEQLANFDPTDQNIDSAVDDALGVKGQIDRANKARDDAAPKYTTLKDGPVERLVQTNPQADGATYVPGQGWTGGAPQPASQPGTASPAAAPAPDASAPIGLRNNNPLNLRPLGQGQWNGQTGVDGGYASFATPQDGWNAAHRNLQTYATAHGINTIQGVISRWAPQGDGANDPGAYAATVAKAVGVDPNAPLDFTNPQVREKVLSAMAQVELGRPYTPPTQGGAPQGQQPAPQPPQSAPQAGQAGVAGGWQPRTVMTGAAEPKIHQVTTQDGVVHTYDISDPMHPRELPIQGAAKAEWQVLTDPKTSQQYRYNPATGKATTLDGSTPYTPQGAQKIASGTARSGAAMATQKFLEEHPEATADDVVKFNATLGERVKAAKDFGSGPQGNTVRSLNVTIQHLDLLQQMAGALQNGNIQAFNAAAQMWKQQTGRAAPVSFNAVAQVAADEVTKSVLNSSGALGDRQHTNATLARLNSPEQFFGVMNSFKGLMAGQLSGLKRQYQNSTGFDDFEDKLDPSTRAALEAHTAPPAGQGTAKPGARPPLSAFQR